MSPLHGYTVLANYHGVNRAGSVATYKCNPGYMLWGDTDSLCGDDGEWHSVHNIGDMSTCDLVTCQHPPDVDHSHMELLNDTLTWGAVIVYTCQHISVSATTTCQIDGSWSELSLMCPDDPAAEWLMSPNKIVIICSITTITFIFVLVISIIFAQKKRVSKNHPRLSKLRHRFDSHSKVKP